MPVGSYPFWYADSHFFGLFEEPLHRSHMFLQVLRNAGTKTNQTTAPLPEGGSLHDEEDKPLGQVQQERQDYALQHLATHLYKAEKSNRLCNVLDTSDGVTG